MASEQLAETTTESQQDKNNDDETSPAPTQNDQGTDQASRPAQDGRSEQAEPETDEQRFAKLIAQRRNEKNAPQPVEPEPEPEPEPENESEPEPGTEPEKASENGSDEAEESPEGKSDAERLKYAEEQLALLQNQYESVSGRLAPAQRENRELMKKLKALQNAQKAEAPNSLKDLEKQSAWKEIEDELPDEADELKKYLTSMLGSLRQEPDEEAHQKLQEERNQWMERELSRLSQKAPNWGVIRSHPRFTQWRQSIEANPDAYPEISRKMASPYHEDTLDILEAFRKDFTNALPKEAEALFPQQVKKDQTPKKRPTPPPPAPPSQGSGMSGAQRNQRPMSDEEAFSAYLKSKNRRR